MIGGIDAEVILQSIQEGLIITGPDAKIRFINYRAVEIFGVQETQARGLYLEELTGHKGVGVAVRDSLVDTGKRPRGRKPETLNVTVNGQEQYFKVETVPVFGYEGLVGTVTLLTDITYYERVDRLRTQFVATVSHEFRNPLTSIAMAVDLLRVGRQEMLPVETEALETAIAEDSQRLIRLVDNLLELSKLEDGQIPMERGCADVADMVSTACSSLHLQMKQKKIKFTLDIPENLPPVYADEAKATWILTNLLGNALRYTPRGGEIIVDACSKGHRVYISVCDSGPGIPAEYHDKVFEKFSQVKEPGKAASGGAGLGLAIARDIVEAHGGRIWVDNTQCKGAKFVFTLPIYNNKGDKS